VPWRPPPAGGDNIIEAGEAVTYTVDIVNNGAAPAYDTVLVDTLPLGMRQGGVTTISVTLVPAGTALPPLAPAYDANTGVASWNFDNGTADAYTIPAGETLRVRTSGGGGYGDPLDRDPALVLSDVRLDKISAAHAETAYGVVVRAGEVDLEATRRVRAARRVGCSHGLPRP